MILADGGERVVGKAPKPSIAVAVLDEVERLLHVSTAYEDYQEGWRRLRSGRTAQATVPLEKARRAEPRQGVDPRGARHRVLPPAALGGG